ncbi:MAG: GIN domain-containing protein [Janthinobacterium lividum]
MQRLFHLQSNVLAGLLGVLAPLALTGCSAGHDADCLKSNGTVVTQRRTLNKNLLTVVLRDNVDVTIVPDVDTYAEVRAGENVINDIVFTYDTPNHLTISNTSTCNWVRSYNTPREVRLHMPRLKNLEQRGYGLLTTDGQFVQDTLFIHSSGPGDINMNVRSVYLFTDNYDAGDITLHGYAEEFHPNQGGNGFLFASDLTTHRCYFHVYREGVGDSHVRTTGDLGGILDGRGTFYYTGNPTFIRTVGSGKLQAE